MKEKKRMIMGVVSAIGMLLLILDIKTATAGAQEGVTLCLTVLIPSLFPFFLLSMLIGNSLTGARISFMRPVSKLCGIPDGGESLLLLGFAGGYPVGAKAVAQAYESGQLQRSDAHRLLGFCSNAGPAFIFGMTSMLFTSATVPWLLWLIHIISAILTGWLLPDKRTSSCTLTKAVPLTIPQALDQSIRTMAGVCGWVILFRVILSFCQRWLFRYIPLDLQILLTGLLELSNGFTSLRSILTPGMRFLLCSIFLSFGGVCVGMQTVSVTQKLGTGRYFQGKLLQCLFSIFLSLSIMRLVFPADACPEVALLHCVSGSILTIIVLRNILLKNKKTVAFV